MAWSVRLPKQNRPLVRDGRLQPAKKKRTDRSYLRPAPAAPAEPDTSEVAVDADIVDDPGVLAAAEAEAAREPDTALLADGPVAMPPPTAPSRRQPTRLTGAARAIQQQGVRKRREVDLVTLARRDTSYAIHELRRIAILAAMVVVTLVVLGVVLR
jgi:hypothetical protein